MQFDERTVKIIIDDSKCGACKTYACVEACKTYARGILTIKDGRPALDGATALGISRGTECLACEYECWFRGNSAITIEAPVVGLPEYRKKHGVL
jgi:hypothetical protein